MNTKDPKQLAKAAAEQITEYAQYYEKIAQAPEWLKNYMSDQYPSQGAGRPLEESSTPALEGGQMMYVAPDPSNLQGIASTVGARTLVDFMAAYQHNPAKAQELAPAAHAELHAKWPEIVKAKGPGKAGVIQKAFEEIFSKFGLGAFASKTNKLSKLATKLQEKYTK